MPGYGASPGAGAMPERAASPGEGAMPTGGASPGAGAGPGRVLLALDPWRWALEPALALLLLTAWLATDAVLQVSGQPGFSGEQPAVMLFVCGSVALCRVAPEIALGLAVLGGLVAVAASDSVLVANGIACFLVLAVAAFGIAAQARRILRWLTFAACVLGGPALAVYLQRAHELAAQLELSGADVLDIRQLNGGAAVLGAALLLSCGLVAAWLAGTLVPARARARTQAGQSDWTQAEQSDQTQAGQSAGRGPGQDAGLSSQREAGSEQVPEPIRPGSWREWLLRPAGALWRTSGGSGDLAREPFGIGDGVDYDGPVVFRRLPPRAVLIDLIAGAAFLLIGVLGSGGESTMVAVAILLSAGLAARRMSPILAIGLCWAAAILQMVLRTVPIVFVGDLAVLGVLYAMAAYGNRMVRWLGLASAFLGAVVAALYLTGSGVEPGRVVDASNRYLRFALESGVVFIALFILFGFCWVLGLLARSRRLARAGVRARLLSEFDRQRAQERVVIEQQRTRIARDMHDVVAHSLAVVIAQADGTRYAHSGEPAIVEESLKTISTTARAALGDVRQLLAELRDGDSGGPQPGTEDLGALIDQLRSAGLEIRFQETGPRLALSPGTQIALYRIVQEALTNALRHGDTSRPVGVDCRWEDEGVEITIVSRLRRAPTPSVGPSVVDARPDEQRDGEQGDGEQHDGEQRIGHERAGSDGAGRDRDGRERAGFDRDGQRHVGSERVWSERAGYGRDRVGHGLPGMRERALLAGGLFHASADGDSFVVRAVLPLVAMERSPGDGDPVR